MSITDDILKISMSEDEIKSIVERIGKELNNDYLDKDPLFIGVLKGAVPFMTDLMKQINIKSTLDYIKVSSYSGTKSTGNIAIKGDMPNVKDRHVIVVEDILDTGKTLLELKKLLISSGALSVKLCVLLDKPEGRKYDISADYVGGKVPNEFVVGYGLDYNERYRNLPYIGVLKEEVYKK
jgi:hypoxanthine phosphoribosyltransferase